MAACRWAFARRLLDDAEQQQFNRGEIVSVAVAQAEQFPAPGMIQHFSVI
jgi:hypothetical protein